MNTFPVGHSMRRTDAPLDQASAFDRLVLPRDLPMPVPGPERALGARSHGRGRSRPDDGS